MKRPRFAPIAALLAAYHLRMRPFAHRLRLAALLLALAAVAGCSTLDVPRADNYPASGQKKARALHHWDVLARDVARRVAEKIASWPPGEHPIEVGAAGASSFNQGFVKLLRVHLLEQGVALSDGPAAVRLEVQTQVVQHGSSDQLNSPVPLPLTVLGAGVGVLYDWQTHYADRHLLPGVATGAGLGLGLALDLARYHTQGAAAGGPTRTEVLVSTWLKSGGQLLAGSADMYYIERADAPLYLDEAPPPPPAPPAKVWKVVTP